MSAVALGGLAKLRAAGALVVSSRTLLGKMVGALAVLLLLSTTVQFLVSSYLWQHYSAEYLQRASDTLAANFVVMLRGEQARRSDFNLYETLVRWSLINPSLEFYAVDGDGTIRVSVAALVNTPRINMEPVRTLLEGPLPELPIFGTNPGSVSSSRSVFSAAPLPESLGGGFLYIIPQGWYYGLSRKVVGQKHVIVGSVVSILLVVSASLLIGLLFFQKLTKNIRIIAGSARRFREGRSEERIAVRSHDEFDEVADAFNEMAETIAAQIQSLKQVDRLRRDFIANVVHDLRAPLSALQGFHEMLLEGEAALSEERKRHIISAAHNNVILQTALVDDLFELAKLEAREREPKKEVFELAPLLELLEISFQPNLEEQNLQIIQRLKPDLRVFADPVLVERVFSNLITNAIRHSRTGGPIELAAAAEGDLVRLEVRDQGVGIAEKHLNEIFDRFYRVETNEPKKEKGTGLGLAIVKRILETHGQRIEVESKVGEGTVFRFWLEAAQGKA